MIRHLVSVDDFSVPEILELFGHARRFAEDLRGHSDLCRGRISASLFFEPSTRTRLSFESAMQRLGGGVLTAADMKSSSAAKGESLADTVRVVSGAYADLIILRHPSEGAARLAVKHSKVPVVNGGDGSHEHPTQTLCDLYTLWIEKGRLDGLDVVLAGDLRYSRTIHSFVYALARFGANIVCVPQPGLGLPEYVLRRLREEYATEPFRADARKLGDLAKNSDVVYMTPQKPHQLSLFTDSSGVPVDRVDAVYMTRPQTERFNDQDSTDNYMRLGKGVMAASPLKDAVVMHPLPRRDEIAQDFDDDPRSVYFEQAARGVPIRMAILAFLLDRITLKARPPEAVAAHLRLDPKANGCGNPTCISNTEVRHTQRTFRVTSRDPLRVSCGFCDQEMIVGVVGCSTTLSFHPKDSPSARKIRADHLVFFRDEVQAQDAGFSASMATRD